MADVPKIMRDSADQLEAELPTLTRYQDKLIILRIAIGLLRLIASELENDD